jgi:hypothetical protein
MFEQITSKDLEKTCGGAFNQVANNAQVARWHQPVIGGALFKLDMIKDYISGRGLITGSGSPGVGG